MLTNLVWRKVFLRGWRSRIFRYHRHTHVFVNDPTMGYGLYIEWMLQESSQI